MMERLQKWTLSLVAMGTIIGSLLGQIISFYSKGEFYFYTLLGTITSATILIIINIIMVYTKREKTPYIDERTKNIVLKFWAYSSHFFLVIVFITLGVIGSMGIENISITYALIIVAVYFLIAGIGTFVVRHRS